MKKELLVTAIVAAMVSAMVTISVQSRLARAADQNQIFRGKAFVLYDGNNKMKGTFMVSPEGTGNLLLFGPGEKPRISLMITPDGSPYININGEDGKSRIMLTYGEGKPIITLNNSPEGTAPLILSVNENHVPVLIGVKGN